MATTYLSVLRLCRHANGALATVEAPVTDALAPLDAEPGYASRPGQGPVCLDAARGTRDLVVRLKVPDYAARQAVLRMLDRPGRASD